MAKCGLFCNATSLALSAQTKGAPSYCRSRLLATRNSNDAKEEQFEDIVANEAASVANEEQMAAEDIVAGDLEEQNSMSDDLQTSILHCNVMSQTMVLLVRQKTKDKCHHKTVILNVSETLPTVSRSNWMEPNA